MSVITSHKDAPTKAVDVGGTTFAYRDLGPRTGRPVIFLNHLAAVLDNWDPRVVDGIASQRRVITFDNRSVGASQGRTPSSIAEMRSAARDFLKRLKERTKNRDKAISVPSFRAHLKAIHGWGVQQPTDLSRIQQAVFVANGDHDRMVPTHNSADLAHRLPNAKLKIYPDAGHGGIFQYHAEFVPEALDFLAA